jgi:4-hydroxy-2-oxoheptanedioate aldolase
MFAHAAFNQTMGQYTLSANDNVMICVQIESRKALENVEEIANVDGIGNRNPTPQDPPGRYRWLTFP